SDQSASVAFEQCSAAKACTPREKAIFRPADQICAAIQSRKNEELDKVCNERKQGCWTAVKRTALCSCCCQPAARTIFCGDHSGCCTTRKWFRLRYDEGIPNGGVLLEIIKLAAVCRTSCRHQVLQWQEIRNKEWCSLLMLSLVEAAWLLTADQCDAVNEDMLANVVRLVKYEHCQLTR
ncbi:hypothetical protein M514_02642, partial [Trichuris suis]